MYKATPHFFNKDTDKALRSIVAGEELLVSVSDVMKLMQISNDGYTIGKIGLEKRDFLVEFQSVSGVYYRRHLLMTDFKGVERIDKFVGTRKSQVVKDWIYNEVFNKGIKEKVEIEIDKSTLRTKLLLEEMMKLSKEDMTELTTIIKLKTERKNLLEELERNQNKLNEVVGKYLLQGKAERMKENE